ncbi:MAG: proton-conducting transporter membrane subunit, partial [Thermoanaerobaculia bacterium]
MTSIAPQEFWLLLPEMVLAIFGMALLVAGTMGRGIGSRMAAMASLVGVGAAMILVVWTQGQATMGAPILAGMFVLDEFALYWKVLFLVSTALTVFLSARFIEEGGYRAGEYYSLLLLATTGMMLMVSGFNLLSIWISLELMALSSYILAGYFKHERRSNEASLKYFVLGALSSGILLYGISLLYGATSTLALPELSRSLSLAVLHGDLLSAVGWILLAVGLFFKVSAAPFHVWTPDVYV